MTNRIPFPTDYGPDTASDFIKIFRLPPEARPSRREILRRFHQPSPPPRPHVPMLDEWMEIPATTITTYLCGGCALNIPDPRGGGDWHDPWHYRRRADDPPKVARLSNDRAANPVLTHVLEHVLGTERTPVDAGAAPAVPASPLRLEATGAHDRNSVAARFPPPPMAGPAVCRQSPEVGAGWFNDHVRICAGGAQQCAFLPQLGAAGGQPPAATRPIAPEGGVSPITPYPTQPDPARAGSAYAYDSSDEFEYHAEHRRR